MSELPLRETKGGEWGIFLGGSDTRPTSAVELEQIALETGWPEDFAKFMGKVAGLVEFEMNPYVDIFKSNDKECSGYLIDIILPKEDSGLMDEYTSITKEGH